MSKVVKMGQHELLPTSCESKARELNEKTFVALRENRSTQLEFTEHDIRVVLNFV
jgi:hypothetical protein